MNRSDWIAVAAVSVALIVGLPGVFSYFRIQPKEADDFGVQFEKFKAELRFSGIPELRKFKIAKFSSILLRNASERPVELQVSLYYSGGKIFMDGKELPRNRVFIEPRRSVTLEIVDLTPIDWLENEALNNIFRRSGDNIEDYLKTEGQTIAGFGKTGSTTSTVLCWGQQQEAQDEARKLGPQLTQFSVSSDTGPYRHCIIGTFKGLIAG